MNPYELQNEIVQSAENFIGYLKDHGQDKITNKLRSDPIIKGNRIILPLANALPSPDLAEVSVRGHFCSPDELEIAGYDETDKCLIVKERDCAGRFVNVRARDIEVKNDITFLARNLKNWALSHADELELPCAEYQNDNALVFMASSNDQQLIAANGVLRNPLSYVWGVPGAGKTTMVLARDAEYCLDHHMKILVTAPTNSALERALISLMEVFDSHGMNTENILRLGVPSPNFRALYPDLCVDSSKGEETRAICRRKISKAKMIAATVDTYITTLSDSELFRPDHIFLDEAGYCPVIKVLPLLNSRADLTLLGDHRQLPPVCPVDADTLRNDPKLCLWAQSSVYCESLMNAESVESFAGDYFGGVQPMFRSMKRFDLFYTYRFGGKLVDVLASHVYGNSFRGLASESPRITVINASDSESSNGRVSQAEAYAILRFLQERHCTDYVVLTPYKKQVAMLRQLLHTDDEHVMTIHRAQGREWDTVILSVVDTNNMYFTDSTRKDTHGLEVLNTAVSRAKKELVIVCNAYFWQHQQGQLISSIVTAYAPAA